VYDYSMPSLGRVEQIAADAGVQYVGDGDCGDTCSMGAKAILAALEDGLGTDGNLIDILRRLTEIIQGTHAQ
jgi:hypothetical protein